MFILTSNMKRASQIIQEKVVLALMTSAMTSQWDFEHCPLYSCLGNCCSRSKYQGQYLAKNNIIITRLEYAYRYPCLKNITTFPITNVAKKFWQVRNRQIACLFVTCQNFQFWQVCSSDGLCVCLSVCNVDDTGRTVKVINTKLYTYMYLGSGYMCIVLGVDDVIDDVIRFTNRSNFEIAITPSIFELERRTKS